MMKTQSQHDRVAQTLHHAELPRSVGVGFKPQFFDIMINDAMPPAFIEVHAENYMGAGGLPHRQLEQLRDRLPLSIHGVGMSIGGYEPIDDAHLDRLATLINRYQPHSFSEHLAWSTHTGRFFNDLLPVPYNIETLNRVCDHIDYVQDRLGLRMLLENPATYLEFDSSTYSETQFITDVIARTGCGLLLDVNNVFVTCTNHRRNPYAYIDELPLSAVGEFHLAGHDVDTDAGGETLLIDSHGSPIADPVWDLYAYALRHTDMIPTLIEWDSNVPDYAVLCSEAQKAKRVMDRVVRAHDLKLA